MELKVIGLGLGRTGTYSLKTALEHLELGPCHHMEGVAQNMPVQLPLWNALLKNPTNFDAVYEGMQSAVDWPTAAFYKELYQHYPNAKFILTHRSKESWAESFIGKFLNGRKYSRKLSDIKHVVGPKMEPVLQK